MKSQIILENKYEKMEINQEWYMASWKKKTVCIYLYIYFYVEIVAIDLTVDIMCRYMCVWLRR